MADTVASLVANVLTEGNFDATEPQVLQWLTRRQRTMCSRTRVYRKKLSIGPTVAEQQAYTVPKEVVEIREVLVNGITYGTGRHSDLAQGAQGYLWLDGLYLDGGGISTREDDSTGTTKLALYPTPTEAGLEVTLIAVCLPPDLVVGEDSTIKVPGDFLDALVAGAIATGLTRIESRPDLAQPFETIFSAACTELETQVNRRFRGAGPAQIRVVGLNA